jgi:hypothetical protein
MNGDGEGAAWMTLLLIGMAALSLVFNTPEPPSPEAVAAAERRLAERAQLEPAEPGIASCNGGGRRDCGAPDD